MHISLIESHRASHCHADTDYSIHFRSSLFVALMSSLDNLVASRYTGGGGRWSRLVRFSADGVLPLILFPLSPKVVLYKVIYLYELKNPTISIFDIGFETFGEEV